MDNPIAANTLGTLGAVCWSIQLIPQILINHQRQNTTGLQPSMMLLWALAGVPLGAYNIVSAFNVALLVQPQILTVLSLCTWGQCGFYGEAAQHHHLAWPIILTGIISTLLLSAGVLRHYYDIYIHHTVRGISFIFVGIDAAGDVFSLVSLFFQEELDILGVVIYATEFVLWCGVFACGGYFNLMPWLKIKARERRERQRAHEVTGNETLNSDVNNGHELENIPSSTSVFRTSGSIISERVPRRLGGED